jgi:hypothetical protein
VSMYVDPAISRAKVDRELTEYLALSDQFRRRGVCLLEYQFPEVLFAMVAANAKPTLLVPFGVLFDFTNYDMAPASIRLVHPLTKAPMKKSELPYEFPRLLPNGTTQELLMAHDDARPFICLQGVREYHDNPAHTGDSWFLHRKTGAGKLVHLLDILAKYGTEPIQGQAAKIQILIGGFSAVAPPL